MQIDISCSPQDTDDLGRYCAVINVADSPCRAFTCPVPHFWFPIHECGVWGYGPFFGVAKALDHVASIKEKIHDNGKPVLVHCHGGANRSPSVVYAVLSSNGKTDEEINQRFQIYGGDMAKIYHRNIRKGCIARDTIPFLKARFEWPAFSLVGLLSAIKSPNIVHPHFKERDE